MAFKLGSSRTPALNKGQIEGRLSFKQTDASVPGTPVLRKKLGGGILGEANNDGTINIDSSVKPGSAKEKEVVAHEEVHMKDMKSGKLAYGDSWIRYKGKTYPRKGGRILYNMKWYPEGHDKLPWEAKAVKAEKKTMVDADVRPKSAAFQKSYKK